MKLHLFDDLPGPPASETYPSTDSEAELLVKQMCQKAKVFIVFILCDDQGIRCVWRRTSDQAVLRELAAITRVTTRFTGTSEYSVMPVEQIEPIDDHERIALESNTPD